MLQFVRIFDEFLDKLLHVQLLSNLTLYSLLFFALLIAVIWTVFTRTR